MRTLLRLCMIVALACAPAFVPSAAFAAEGPRVLILTTGNEAADVAKFAVERLQMEARRWGFTLEEGTPEDLADLGGYDVVMFVNTGQDLLDEGQQAALQAFVEGGGGFVATNSAAASERNWPFYQEMLGATVTGPPQEGKSEKPVTFFAGSPITEGLDEELEVSERWYAFDPGPDEQVSTILGEFASGEAAAWSSDRYQVVYASMGGEGDTWGDRDFLQLMRQSIWWAAGEEGPLVQNSDDAAPPWPYMLTFVLFVIAVAGGGSIAVWRLDKAETAEAEPEAPKEPVGV